MVTVGAAQVGRFQEGQGNGAEKVLEAAKRGAGTHIYKYVYFIAHLANQ